MIGKCLRFCAIALWFSAATGPALSQTQLDLSKTIAELATQLALKLNKPQALGLTPGSSPCPDDKLSPEEGGKNECTIKVHFTEVADPYDEKKPKITVCYLDVRSFEVEINEISKKSQKLTWKLEKQTPDLRNPYFDAKYGILILGQTGDQIDTTRSFKTDPKSVEVETKATVRDAIANYVPIVFWTDPAFPSKEPDLCAAIDPKIVNVNKKPDGP